MTIESMHGNWTGGKRTKYFLQDHSPSLIVGHKLLPTQKLLIPQKLLL